MRKNEITIGEIFAVVTGSMYEGAEAYADAARVLETGIEVANYSGSMRWSRNPSSRSNDGVRILVLDRKTLEPQIRPCSNPDVEHPGFPCGHTKELVVKSRHVVATWEKYCETQQARRDQEAAVDKRRQDTAAELAEWVARLGINEYQLPSLSGGVGSRGFDATYTHNRAALIRVIKLAYELGVHDAIVKSPTD